MRSLIYDLLSTHLHNLFLMVYIQMVDAWGGWGQFQVLLKTLQTVASKHGVKIPTVAVRYILNQVKLLMPIHIKHTHIYIF